MGWTAPKTWTAGETLTAVDLNTHVRDNLEFLHSPPWVALKRTSNQVIDNNTWTRVQNWSVVDGDASLLNSLNRAVEVPISPAGMWEFCATVRWATSDVGARIIRLVTSQAVFGATEQRLSAVQAVASVNTVDSAATILPRPSSGVFTVELWVWQGSGGTLDLVAADNAPMLTARWVGGSP